jgi:shikimate dehydrogenase/3-dehydroquinate dehydratase type I
MQPASNHGGFPLQGVIGVLSSPAPCEQAELAACFALGMRAVEVRADLLLKGGPAGAWSPERILEQVRDLRTRGWGVLFTVRVPAQGGAFDGPEPERIRLYERALDAGAQAIDVEWGTGASRARFRPGTARVISLHAFDSAPSEVEIERQTAEISGFLAGARASDPEAGPAAIKIVPTAATLADAVRMLRWAGAAPPGAPRRIGFAMGPKGVIGRILALAWGSQLTYGGLGSAVAPGQIPARELLSLYAPQRWSPKTRIFGVAGARALGSFSPFLHNPAFQARGMDAVYLPIQADAFSEVAELAGLLAMSGLSVTVPFKEDARRFATEIDARCRDSGAANTLIWRPPGPRAPSGAVAGRNTDYDGVLLPLARKLGSLAGVSAAVIGNGGAARGAVLALKEAGASPTLYYRNRERGDKVAVELGVAGKLIAALARDRPRVIVNATPLGTRAEDPSPVPAECWEAAGTEPPRVAFEMVYEPADTRFLEDARAAGAVEIPGREMLVAQGVAQFRLFTGLEASEEEFDRSYREGRRRYREPRP